MTNVFSLRQLGHSIFGVLAVEGEVVPDFKDAQNVVVDVPGTFPRDTQLLTNSLERFRFTSVKSVNTFDDKLLAIIKIYQQAVNVFQ